MLETLGLAEVKKVAPRLKLDTGQDALRPARRCRRSSRTATKCSRNTRNRCARLALTEIRALRARAVSVDRAVLKRWLHIDTSTLPQAEREQRERVLKASSKLATVYTMRDELAALWQRSTASKEQLVHQLEDWCKRAEASGIEALQAFSRRLRCYA